MHSAGGAEISDDTGFLVFTIGDIDIAIHFETGDEMAAFCQMHNFPYYDERERVAL